MATSTNVDVIIGARDNASSVIQGVGKTAKQAGSSISDTFKEGGIAATGFITALTGVGVAMANIASDFEQNRISFETMLGSAEKGRKALADLSNFAVSTPFEMPQLMQASKSLLAYGIEAENLIPTLRMLGDISSGVGMDKLPQLILAFGQVKAATKLTGMELRQFTEAGVPLLQALVDQANKAGGSWVTVGGVSEKTKAKLDALNTTLAKQNNRLAEMTAKGNTTSASYKNLQIDIANTQSKIAGLGDTTGKTSRVFQKTTVTVEQMKDMISDGQITFDQVKAALAGMTGEGGRFFQLMEKQSKTFGGVMSNIKDQVIRSLAEIAGIDIQAGGIIREGSLFFVMKQLAEGLLGALNMITPKIVAFTKLIFENEAAVGILGGAILGGLVLAIGAFVATFGAGLLILGKFIIIGGIVGGVVGALIKAFGGFEGIASTVQGALDNIRAKLDAFKPVVQGYLDEFVGQFQAFSERLYDTFDLDASQIGFVDFFTQMGEQIRPHLDGVVAQIKQGFTNAFNINFGEGGNIGDLFGRLMAILQPVGELFFRVMTPAIETFKKSLEVAKPHLDVFLQQIGPILINALQVLVGAFAVVAAVVLAVLSGIMQAVAVALPFVIQMFSGFAQIINGILTIIVGIFTLNFGMVWEGIKTTFKGIFDTIAGALLAIVGLVVGFVKGIIDFFKQLYDTLIGHSIIPDLVNGAIRLFTQMKDTIVNTVKGFIDTVVEKFNWLKDQVTNVIDAIKNLIDNFKPKFKIDLQLPDIEGAWRSLKDRAKSIGIPGFQTGGIVPGPIGAPQLVMAHGGEEIRPFSGGSSGRGGGVGSTFNVYIGMYAGTETEKRNVAKELYGALLQVAQSQNKNVAEFMGG